MKKLALLFVPALLIVAVGCSGGATTNEDINAAAKELQEKSKGVEPQPDPAVVDKNNPGGGMIAPKPGRK